MKLPFLLTDHMVVQRHMPVHVWGSGAPGEKIVVHFRAETATTVTDRLGRWSVYLLPGAAGGPFDLQINDIILRDVMVGDVWIASGQSNMEWPVRWSAEPQKEMAAAKYPNIRLVRTMHRVSDYPRDEFYGVSWSPCTPQSIEHFSAVGYHFARNIHERTRVPIGIIQSAWGGTPLEAWTPLAAIGEEPALMPLFTEWAELTAKHETNVLEWKVAPAPKPELRRRPGGQWTPAGLFNAMIAPLTKMAIRGVIWYQGEANTTPERAPLYERLFPAMIRGWRKAWNGPAFPFYFVQLANYNAAEDSMWPELREAQRRALHLTNTAMAVTIDIGEPDDIHPRNKREVGRRLSLAARALSYDESIVYSGPLFRTAVRENDAVRIWFDHAGSGLRANGDLTGFELAGADRVFHSATARIDGYTVVVSGVEEPRFVRYAWKDNPEATLFNKEGLPASPFAFEGV